MYMNVQPNLMRQTPYLVNEIEAAHLFNHIQGNEIATPFVSLSSSLAWVLRVAMRERSKNGRKLNISVISGQHLDRRGLYYLKPFQTNLRKYYPYVSKSMGKRVTQPSWSTRGVFD
jgi:hypothetical protein